MFKRKVGRPSKKTLKRERNIKLIGLLLVSFLFILLIYNFSIYMNDNPNKLSAKVNKININNLQISPIPDQVYTGKSIHVGPAVKHNGVILTKGKDYKLSFPKGKNIEIGIGKVKVVGIGNYTGSKIVTFNIVPEYYVITYDANGGTNAPQSQKYKYNSMTTKISIQVPVRQNYKFLYWQVIEDSTKTFKPNEEVPRGYGNISLVAVWEEVKVQPTPKPKPSNNTTNTSQPGKVNIRIDVNGATSLHQYTDVVKLGDKKYMISNSYLIFKRLTTDEDGDYCDLCGPIEYSIHTINYNGQLGSQGLMNMDSCHLVKLSKKGYKLKKNAEYKCKSGCTQKNKIFNDTTAYKASDFCDASKGDCTVILKVNWVKGKEKTCK